MKPVERSAFLREERTEALKDRWSNMVVLTEKSTTKHYNTGRIFWFLGGKAQNKRKPFRCFFTVLFKLCALENKYDIWEQHRMIYSMIRPSA